MALVYKDRVKQTVDAPATTSPFDFDSNGATPTGYQSFVDALADGDTCIYAAEDASGNWETGIGTWAEANNTLTRTTILASSNSGSAETFTGTVTVFITVEASQVRSDLYSDASTDPGGRLTLTSGTPVTSSDVTGATTIYYTPYTHSGIPLWDGSRWVVTNFAETSLALGTVTSGKPYDVFGYLNAGALALEKLIWTDDTTRATAITIQNGRYCKSGDPTRLYLGSFYTTSTSATEDSETKRYLFNNYNRVLRTLKLSDGVSNTYGHTYNTSGYRKYNNGDYIYFNLLSGNAADFEGIAICTQTAASGSAGSQIGWNLTDGSGFDLSVMTSAVYAITGGSGEVLILRPVIRGQRTLPDGKYTVHCVERALTTTTPTVTWGYAALYGRLFA